MFTLNVSPKVAEPGSKRRGVLQTPHGQIKAPFFMPIATKGAVKSLSTEDMSALSAQILLSNTYHMMLRPGAERVRELGGLHQFMQWSKPILTDSGGFQVFSLANIRSIDEKGVTFRSHLDGQQHILTPERSIDIQAALGVDIMMVLDHVIQFSKDRTVITEALERTTRWAKRSFDYWQKIKHNSLNPEALLFGIVQGGFHEDTRAQSAKQLLEIPFDGFAIGGIAVSEPIAEMKKVLDTVVPMLPADKPRYAMGVGRPEDIVAAVNRGVDMFDCVIPTREARHGRLYHWVSDPTEDASFYQTSNITNTKFASDQSAINKSSTIPLLQKYSKAYLHHLFHTKEILGTRLATLNNLEFYLLLMKKLRKT